MEIIRIKNSIKDPKNRGKNTKKITKSLILK